MCCSTHDEPLAWMKGCPFNLTRDPASWKIGCDACVTAGIDEPGYA